MDWKNFSKAMIIVALATWGMMQCKREKIPFDTPYQVTYTNVAGQEITKKIYMPAGINGMEVRPDDGSYNLYVIYDNARQADMVQPAVIDFHRLKKIK